MLPSIEFRGSRAALPTDMSEDISRGGPADRGDINIGEYCSPERGELKFDKPLVAGEVGFGL